MDVPDSNDISTKIDNYYYQSSRSSVRYMNNKVVIKVLQGHVVTQTVLGGITIYPPVANFL